MHELAHQWVGDKLTLARWQDIWLNEGFASYTEWLWLEHEGLLTAQEGFDLRASIPADSGFWDLPIGDPGPDGLFDGAVYERGAMTLHALRLQVGDDAFFAILRDWASQRPGHVTTPDFVALAERVSGQDLDAFFELWLHSGVKPDGLPDDPWGPPAGEAATRVSDGRHAERSPDIAPAGVPGPAHEVPRR
ncbi:M1 family aminopeptidase [Cellulomonas sp. ATA003]|uniref:M1 family aminopeptidase n=1 Tax=Cellulomonas sp. ATA003 TaxID=3073064 RepID=UPI0028738A1D|nr:M1 family aminopeptidase [Cellulomonas sp. ATA003]WNB87443.1 M1 family aminopeptidase [Cellulomonas sp. ATA003]